MTANAALMPNDLMGFLDPPNYGQDVISALVRDLYGIKGRMVPMEGERDQNVLVCADGFPRSVLKIGQPSDSRAFADYQAQILLHLERNAPDLPVPRVIPTTRGEAYSHYEFPDGRQSAVKLITYLAGGPLPDASGNLSSWAWHVGVMQADICKALAGFNHPESKIPMPWNATSASVFDDQILALLEPDFRDLLSAHMHRLRTLSLPRLQGMHAQVIHNDIHAGNVLWDDQGSICGVIDFGDAVNAPIIQEIAVSAVSLMEMGAEDPVRAVDLLVQGFSRQYHLDAEERAFLYDGMLLRSMLNVAFGRLKDKKVPVSQRPRPATLASQTALRKIIALMEAGAFEVQDA